MVHQLSLVSSIPHSKYVQTLSTLSALTGLANPQDISTYTLITKPHNVFRPKFEPGKVNQIEQYFMKCTTIWSDETSQKLSLEMPVIKDVENDDVLVDRLFSEEERIERNWTLQISDIPIAGKNQACSAQTVYESTLVHTHTIIKEEVKESAEVTEPETKVETKEANGDVKMEAVEDVKEVKEEPKEETKEEPIVVKEEPKEVKEVAKEETKEEVKEPAKEEAKEGAVEVKEETKTSPEVVNVDASPEVVEIEDAMDIDLVDLDDLEMNEGEKKEEEKTEGENNGTKVTEKQEDKAITPAPVKETSPAPKKDSFLQFLDDLGYDVINQYWVKGVRFFHKDIVIEIFKVFIRDDTARSSDPSKIKLKLLDDTNTLQIKTYINIPKSTDVELINSGTKDLLKLQEFLKNLFVLEIPDRMFMDSRVINK